MNIIKKTNNEPTAHKEPWYAPVLQDKININKTQSGKIPNPSEKVVTVHTPGSGINAYFYGS